MASLSLGSIVIFLSALTLCYGTIEILYELGVDEYELPDLPYNYSGLEPYLDEKTLIVHHQGHHKAYTNKMNAALKEWRKEVCLKNSHYKYFHYHTHRSLQANLLVPLLQRFCKTWKTFQRNGVQVSSKMVAAMSTTYFIGRPCVHLLHLCIHL